MAAQNRAAHAMLSKKTTVYRQKHEWPRRKQIKLPTKTGHVVDVHSNTARGHLCKICNKLNHFAKVCRSKQPVTRRTVHTVENTGILEADELLLMQLTKSMKTQNVNRPF